MSTNARTRDSSSHLNKRATTIAKDFHEVGDAARRVAVDSAEAIRETAGEYLDEGKTRMRDLGDTVQAKLRDRPLRSVLIAAGVGFLLGAIWTRR